MTPDPHVRSAIRNYISAARANLVMVEATLDTADRKAALETPTVKSFPPQEVAFRAAVATAAKAARDLELASDWLVRLS